MNLPTTRLRTAAFLAAVAAGSFLAAPPADANMAANVKDGLNCIAKVLNPMTPVEWAFDNFRPDSPKSDSAKFDRMADASTEGLRAQCRESLENIYARAFGVEKVVAKARDVASWVKNGKAALSAGFGKGATAGKADRRMALAVSKPERRFYEKEARILDREPLPAVKEPARAAAEATRSTGATQSAGAGSASAWDEEPAHDPWSDEGSNGAGSAWDAAASDAAKRAEAQRILDQDAAHRRWAQQQAPRETAGNDYASYENAVSRVLGETPRGEPSSQDDYDYARALAGLEAQRDEERRADEALREAELEAARLAALREEERELQEMREREQARQRARQQELEERMEARRQREETTRGFINTFQKGFQSNMEIFRQAEEMRREREEAEARALARQEAQIRRQLEQGRREQAEAQRRAQGSSVDSCGRTWCR